MSKPTLTITINEDLQGDLTISPASQGVPLDQAAAMFAAALNTLHGCATAIDNEHGSGGAFKRAVAQAREQMGHGVAEGTIELRTDPAKGSTGNSPSAPPHNQPHGP